MNWDAVGAIAEAAGAIAIFVSLVYVAVQIRQNTLQNSRSIEAAQLAAFERNIESANHIRELLILDPDLARLLQKGYGSFKGLDKVEQFRFGLLMRNIFTALQGAYIRQHSVNQDLIDVEGTGFVVDELLAHRGVREWLEISNWDWRPAFQEIVDARLAAIKQGLEEE